MYVNPPPSMVTHPAPLLSAACGIIWRKNKAVAIKKIDFNEIVNLFTRNPSPSCPNLMLKNQRRFTNVFILLTYSTFFYLW
jgi:hypothetical protein